MTKLANIAGKRKRQVTQDDLNGELGRECYRDRRATKAIVTRALRRAAPRHRVLPSIELENAALVPNWRLQRTEDEVRVRYNISGSIKEWGNRYNPPMPPPTKDEWGDCIWNILHLTAWERPLSRRRAARKALAAAIAEHRRLVVSERPQESYLSFVRFAPAHAIERIAA